MIYAGLAMLGLAAAAILMVLLAPPRGFDAEREEDGEPVRERSGASLDSGAGAAAQPGS